MMDPRYHTRLTEQSAHAAQFIGFFNTFPDLVQQPDLLKKFEKVVEWAKKRAGDEWDDEAGLELVESLGEFPWSRRDEKKGEVGDVEMRDVDDEPREDEEDERAQAIPALTAAVTRKRAPKKTSAAKVGGAPAAKTIIAAATTKATRKGTVEKEKAVLATAATVTKKTTKRTTSKDTVPKEPPLKERNMHGRSLPNKEAAEEPKNPVKTTPKPQDEPPAKRQRTTATLPRSVGTKPATSEYVPPSKSTTTGVSRKAVTAKAPATAAKPGVPTSKPSKATVTSKQPTTSTIATGTTASKYTASSKSKPALNSKKPATRLKPAAKPKPKSAAPVKVKVKPCFPPTTYEAIKYTPGEIVFWHCNYKAIRKWRKAKGANRGGVGFGRELDLNQLLMACMKVEMTGAGRSTGNLMGKVFLERNLRRGRKWGEMIGMKGFEAS